MNVAVGSCTPAQQQRIIYKNATQVAQQGSVIVSCWACLQMKYKHYGYTGNHISTFAVTFLELTFLILGCLHATSLLWSHLTASVFGIGALVILKIITSSLSQVNIWQKLRPTHNYFWCAVEGMFPLIFCARCSMDTHLLTQCIQNCTMFHILLQCSAVTQHAHVQQRGKAMFLCLHVCRQKVLQAG